MRLEELKQETNYNFLVCWISDLDLWIPALGAVFVEIPEKNPRNFCGFGNFCDVPFSARAESSIISKFRTPLCKMSYCSLNTFKPS